VVVAGVRNTMQNIGPQILKGMRFLSQTRYDGDEIRSKFCKNSLLVSLLCPSDSNLSSVAGSW
jgi:hypothetical protein